ncbi:MAG: aspartate-semialdehyde dehydrogenase [Clostridiales bacterium]|jgi:aspartate-semialdehyde dehydrogenase|nr:aspartate-semialdehyde dehydrogenase [Clostridiales bacterium]
MNSKPRVAIIGATGMVGRAFLTVLEEERFPAGEYALFASARSAGSILRFQGREYVVRELNEQSFDSGFDIALFSAGGETSSKFAPIAADRGCVVIDNSSAWRMDPAVPLVVPEVNPDDVWRHRGIIANPNCNVIPATVALKPLYDAYGIRRIVCSTYQAVSGAGVKGWEDLENGLKELPPKKFAHPIAGNCLPHIDVFLENGYTREEMKLVNETRKILGDASLRITATAVRVPVFIGHSTAVSAELLRPFDMAELKEKLARFPGLVLQDDVQNNVYPTPLSVSGRNEVFVGRARRDESVENGVNLWVVADNVRKGAATNAVQIARLLLN